MRPQLTDSVLQAKNPAASYPTPTSAHKRKRSSTAGDKYSSDPATSEEDSSRPRGAQNRQFRNRKLTFEDEAKIPQEKDDDALYQPTPSALSTFESMAGRPEEGKKAHVELRRNRQFPSFRTKPKSPTHKTTTNDFHGLPSQRTLKEAGFTAFTKPETPKGGQKGLQETSGSGGTGGILQTSTTGAVAFSDDESLPEDPIAYFRTVSTPDGGERNIENGNSGSPMQDFNESMAEAPMKTPETPCPRIVRLSNTIRVRRTGESRSPDRKLLAEGTSLDSAHTPRTAEVPPLERLEQNQTCVRTPTVDDSEGSPTSRETSGASRINLQFPKSEMPTEPADFHGVDGTILAHSDQVRGVDHVETGQGFSNRAAPQNLINFWVLRTSKPHNKWVNWADASLDRETSRSIFKTLHQLTENSACRAIDVQLKMPKEEYEFQIHRDRSRHFEAMKDFMLQMIGGNHDESGGSRSTISIYLKPACHVREM